MQPPMLCGRSRLIQLRYKTVGRFVMATNDDHLLTLVRLLLAIEGATILSFGIADNHVHLVIEARSGQPGRAVQAVTQTLTKGGGLVLSPTWAKPVEDATHLENIVKYQIRQPTHHGLPTPDALWPGSVLQDLVGARRYGTFRSERLFAHLPRLRPDDLLARVGVAPLEPLDHEALTGMGPDAIARAAAGAIGRSDLRGSEQEVLAARRAAVALIRRAGLPSSRIAPRLGVGRHTVRRDEARQPDEGLLRVVIRQLELRNAVQQRLAAPLPGESR